MAEEKNVKRCPVFGHGVELDKQGNCFICENERRSNDRHLAEQKEIAAVKAKYRTGVF